MSRRTRASLPSGRAAHAALGLSVALAALAACHKGASPVVVGPGCFEIGCDGSLTVTINGAPADSLVTVVATSPDIIFPGSPIMPKACTSVAGSCSVGFSLSPDSFPTSVTLQVSWSSQTATFAVHPIQYSTNQPNGPGCDPTCYMGVVSVTVPPASATRRRTPWRGSLKDSLSHQHDVMRINLY